MSEKRVSKRHGRLENFLQKQLPQEYSRVSWYEPCVVVVDNGKPAFSFIVVTDEHLYVIGNPPRQIQKSLNLATISNIDIVNDFPDFLTGTDREQAQHIRISHRPLTQEKNGALESGRTSSQASRSPSENSQNSNSVSRMNSSAMSISVLSEAASTLSVPAGYGIEPIQKNNGVLSRRRRLRKLLLTLPLKIREKFHIISGQNSPNPITPTSEDGESHQSHDSGIGSDISNGDDVSEIKSPFSPQGPDFLFRSPSPSPWQGHTSRREADVFNFTLSVPLSRSNDCSPNSPYPRSPVNPHGNETYMLTPVFPSRLMSNYPSDDEKSQNDLPSPMNEPQTPNSVMSNEDVLAGLLQLPTSSVTLHVQSNVRSQTALGNYADHKPNSRPNSQCRPSRNTFDENSEYVDTAKTPKLDIQSKSSEIHVYVLTPQCPLYRFLIYAWNNLLIQCTIKMDVSNTISMKNGPKDRYELMMDDLQRHISGSSDNDFAKTRLQLDGIFQSIQISPVAKRLFWKSPTLFPSIVNKLRSLLGAPENRHEKQTIGLTMDKLKLCSVILSILDAFLQGADAATTSRLAHLTNKNSRATRELLLGLLAVPWTPLAYRDVILDVVTSHRRLSSQDWELFQEAPLIRSVLELTHHSASALYNVMQIAYQGKDTTGRPQVFSMPWIIKVITEVKQWEVYVSRLMSQVLCLCTPSGPTTLSPIQTVYLHQKLYVIYLMANHSPLCDIQFRINYAEDVRYFVLRKVLSQKVPGHYPIRQSLLQLADNIRRHVLGKQPTAQSSLPFQIMG